MGSVPNGYRSSHPVRTQGKGLKRSCSPSPTGTATRSAGMDATSRITAVAIPGEASFLQPGPTARNIWLHSTALACANRVPK